MANNRLTFQGLEELRAWLRTLPAHLTDEGAEVVFRAADDAENEIASKTKSDAMRSKLRVTKDKSRFGAVASVQNTHPHAKPYEYGTQVRYTHLGYNRGSMPPANVFKPAAVRARRAMNEKLVAMMRREGFVVG